MVSRSLTENAERSKINLMVLEIPSIESPSPSTIYLVIKCELLQDFVVLLYIICFFDTTVDGSYEMRPNLGRISMLKPKCRIEYHRGYAEYDK